VELTPAQQINAVNTSTIGVILEAAERVTGLVPAAG
jgi:hypothetical protein